MALKSDMAKKVIKRIEEEREENIRFLQELVKIPSISGKIEEGKAQEIVLKKLREINNLKIDIWEPDLKELEKYPLNPIRLSEWSYKNRPNIVGTIKGSGHGKSLILNGHIDVVSPEPIMAWKHDPWKGEIKGGKLYGRGSLDCKAGIAAMIYAVKCVQDVGVKLKGDVILESVVDEELGGGGTIATILKGYKADAAIVTEPTGSRYVQIGFCGNRWCNIKILGRSGHAGGAYHGINAIDLAVNIYNSLMELDERRCAELKGKHPIFEMPMAGQIWGRRPTGITVGVLRAGDWPTTTAGMAELTIRIGFPPSERGEDVMKQVEDTVKNISKQNEWINKHPPKIEWFGSRKEGYELNPESPIVQTLKYNIENVSGRNCELYGACVSSDANHLGVKIGDYGGIPTICYGPGGANAHAADEFVILKEVITVTKVLSLTIMDWCGY
ncbi:MAG: ArgE/DapE family deacylase [Candidatus Bathyarchaeia archaeon]